MLRTGARRPAVVVAVGTRRIGKVPAATDQAGVLLLLEGVSLPRLIGTE
jgi:hypothetical protein